MKHVSLELLSQICAEAKAAGKVVVHCHGCFDVATVGHKRHLESAKRLGDLLVVTVTPNHFVNKGPDKPVFDHQLRAEMLSGFASVDYVSINQWATAEEAIALLKPSIYVKGSEFRGRMTRALAAEEAMVLSHGGRLVFTDEEEFHTTDLMRKVLAHG